MVLNLSQQTDSSDLLGGFRPVEARAALAPLLVQFQELVADTWTRGRNAEFLTRVARVAERRKWPQLLAAFRSALRKVRCCGFLHVCIVHQRAFCVWPLRRASMQQHDAILLSSKALRIHQACSLRLTAG